MKMAEVLVDLSEVMRLIAEQGAKFCGIQESPRGRLILFNDPVSGTTMALAEPEFSAEALELRIVASRRAFDYEKHRF